MNRLIAIALTLACAMWMSTATGLAACDEFQNVTNDEAKDYRDKLLDSSADSLDRLFAFEKLVCSSNPTLRDYAIREGLKSTGDPLIRNQILLDAMLQKSRIDLKLSSDGDLSEAGKLYVKQKAGLLSYGVAYVSAKEGCISLYASDRCAKGNSVFVRGDKIDFNYDRVFGEFRLTEANELVGFVTTSDAAGDRIAAVMTLF